jgi:hypothetical protein
VTLVHEAAGLYAPHALQPMVEASDRLVFSSKFILSAAQRQLALPPQRTRMAEQGLQRDNFGALPRETARAAICDELELPYDTQLIVGCGTVDFRKGVDLFVAAAMDVLERQPSEAKPCFIWIGAGERSVISSFVGTRVLDSGRQDQIRFIGERRDVEPYFVAADVFLMTSRVDPFPCVCQEAMACGTPIVAFRDGGGTVEMIGDKAGYAVPNFDPSLMADRILELLRDVELRQKLGGEGKRIAAERWAPRDYALKLLHLAAEAGGYEIALREPSASRPTSRGRVFLLFDDWSNTTLTAEAETAVRQLRKGGFDAFILLTRGRLGESAAQNQQRVPKAPYLVLQPGSDPDGKMGGTSARSIFEALLRFCRGAGPAVLVTLSDPLAASLASLLPANIRVVGWLRDAGEAAIRDLYDTGPELDAILAPEAAAPALLAANPGLRTRTQMVDSEGVGGRVARQVLAAQLKDIASGGAIRRLRLGDNAFDDIPWTAERRRAGGKS